MNRANSATGWVRNPDRTLGWTWDPITGCLNHTPEGLCLGGMFPCYAYKLANGRLRSRYLANSNWAHWDPPENGYNDPFYPRFWEDRLNEIRSVGRYSGGHYWRKIKGIFVCDMSDLFGIGVPEEWTRKVMDSICHPLNHYDRFYLLTKQPQNLPQWSSFPDNCWVGVTATNEDMFAGAIFNLNRVEATVKYISFEPLLSWVRVVNLDFALTKPDINWVIIGAQTKPYKPPKIEWVEEIVRACDKAGIPVFLKENLEPLFQPLMRVPNIAWWGNVFGLRQEMPR